MDIANTSAPKSTYSRINTSIKHSEINPPLLHVSVLNYVMQALSFILFYVRKKKKKKKGELLGRLDY